MRTVARTRALRGYIVRGSVKVSRTPFETVLTVRVELANTPTTSVREQHDQHQHQEPYSAHDSLPHVTTLPLFNAPNQRLVTTRMGPPVNSTLALDRAGLPMADQELSGRERQIEAWRTATEDSGADPGGRPLRQTCLAQPISDGQQRDLATRECQPVDPVRVGTGVCGATAGCVAGSACKKGR